MSAKLKLLQVLSDLLNAIKPGLRLRDSCVERQELACGSEGLSAQVAVAER